MMTRRRFLALSACATALPGRAAPPVAPPVARWRGVAMGSVATLTLSGLDDHAARPIFARVEAELARIEARFSLHRDSALTRLNRDGRLAWPGAEILELFSLADAVHAATGGAFDPSVQPLWRAIAEGRDPGPARAALGWAGVEVSAREIRLARPGMALTFNGIAQGLAADLLADAARRHDLSDLLIDSGEIRALGPRDWQAGLADAGNRVRRRIALRNRALATSSPRGTLIGPAGAPHIIASDGRRTVWDTVSVSAPSAALADGLSTALCLMSPAETEIALAELPDCRIEMAIPA